MYGAEQNTKDWVKVISSRASIEKLSTPFSEDAAPLQRDIFHSYKKILDDHKVKPHNYSAKAIAQRIAEGEIVSFYHDRNLLFLLQQFFVQ